MFTTLSAEDLALTVDFPEAARLAKIGGFDAVDLPMQELLDSFDGSSTSRVSECLASSGLRAGGWWLPVEFRADAETYAAGLESLPKACALVQAVGSRWCNTWLWPCSDDIDYASNLRLHVDRLTPIASILAESGCVLGLEFVGPRTLRAGHRYEFISTMAETLDLIDRIGRPNVGVLLDCWQWYTSHGTAEELAALEPGQVTYVHLNDAPSGLDIDSQIDNQRALPGATGVIDIDTFMSVLKALEFDGPVAVEPYNAELNALEPADRVRAARESVSAVYRQAGITLA